MEKVRLEEVIRRHGFRRTCREAGISLATLETAVRGTRVPKEVTAGKIARALGVGVDEIAWPLGYGERIPGNLLRVNEQLTSVSQRAPSSSNCGKSGSRHSMAEEDRSGEERAREISAPNE